jgi:hypothetical protein
VKALVVRDSHTPDAVLRRAFERLNGNHRRDYLQIGASDATLGSDPNVARKLGQTPILRGYGRLLGRAVEQPQVGMQRTEVEASPSGQHIHEYAGSRGQIIERLSDRDGPVVRWWLRRSSALRPEAGSST